MVFEQSIDPPSFHCCPSAMHDGRMALEAHRIAEHDDVAAEIRSWFTKPAPAIGLDVDELWSGYLNRHRAIAPRLLLTVDDPAAVERALAEVTERCDGRSFVVQIDDRRRAALLGETLAQAGFVPEKAVTYLALVGVLAAEPGPPELAIRQVAVEELDRWATVKVRSFADDESRPAPERIAEEATVRRSEAAIATYTLGSLSGHDVAVLGYYGGEPDELVFNLGTRVPWRHRGIAQALLRHWVESARARVPRSFIINADEGGLACQLYQRIGFRDEIYWYQRYRRSA